MKRDFASLTAQEALHVAIFVEERNAEIYHQFAEMFAEFHDPESLEKVLDDLQTRRIILKPGEEVRNEPMVELPRSRDTLGFMFWGRRGNQDRNKDKNKDKEKQ